MTTIRMLACAVVGIALGCPVHTTQAQGAAPRAESAAWRLDGEIARVGHEGGAVGDGQAAQNLADGGASAELGVSRSVLGGVELRLAARTVGIFNAYHHRTDCVVVPASAPAAAGSPGYCPVSAGNLVMAGLSLDGAVGTAPGIPLGLEAGVDLFRTLAVPEGTSGGPPPEMFIGGVHATGLIALGSSGRWHLTVGVQRLAGGLLQWLYPIGLRVAR